MSRPPRAVPIPCPEAVARCFVCGPRHPRGLHVRFSRRDDRVRGSFVPRRDQEGFRGLFHGGLLAAIFDCLTYRVPVVAGVTAAVTARMEIDLKRPMPLGRRLRFEAWLVSRRGRVFDVAAEARLGREVAATARAVYVEVDPGRLPAVSAARRPRRR